MTRPAEPLVIPSEVEESLTNMPDNAKDVSTCARHDRKMNSLGYLILGLIGGGILIAIIFCCPGPNGQRRVVRENRVARTCPGTRRTNAARRDDARSRGKCQRSQSQREELTASLESVRGIVDLRLQELQKDNAQQIERMRATVDEKLQGTPRKTPGRIVQARERAIGKGTPGSRRDAATGKRRRWIAAGADECESTRRLGRSALGALLEQLLTPEQFDRNVQTRDESSERVDYAIKLPG